MGANDIADDSTVE